jgi:hypothetical protein
MTIDLTGTLGTGRESEPSERRLASGQSRTTVREIGT